MLTTAQHKLTSAITSAERQRGLCRNGAFQPNILNLSCKLQKRTAAGEDPKPHSKTLADERTCWTKASHWSESQRIHPCFSWKEKLVNKQSLGQHCVLDHGGRRALGDVPIPNKEPHVPFCRALRFIQITTLRGMLGHTGQQHLC